MPRRRKPKPTDVPEAVLDYFAGPARIMTAGEVEDAMRRYKKALLERALGAEVTHHLGYATTTTMTISNATGWAGSPLQSPSR